MLLMEAVRRQAEEFDVLHFHMDYWSFSLFGRQRTPFVTTLHGRLDLPELQPVFNMFPNAPVVSISDSQRKPLPQANYVDTVLHGLPETLLTPQGEPQGYLAFLGRIAPEKCPDRAILIAQAAGMPIKLAAKVDVADKVYFDQKIRHLLDLPHVEMIGEINDRQKPGFLSGATALLMPIDWPEPFGLVMIEAMACGTPVIAFNRGSVPEIVEDGVTGFVVETMDQAIAAVGRIHTLDRARVRQRFEERFTARRMAEDYLDVYRSLAGEDRSVLRAIR